jgi:glucose dehydrogenase
VIVGLAMADTLCTCSPGSRITAFGARSGSVVWRWYPIPPAADDAAAWDNGSWAETGCGEMWSIGAVDRGARPPILPHGGRDRDFYGGTHKGAPTSNSPFAETTTAQVALADGRLMSKQNVSRMSRGARL